MGSLYTYLFYLCRDFRVVGKVITNEGSPDPVTFIVLVGPYYSPNFFFEECLKIPFFNKAVLVHII